MDLADIVFENKNKEYGAYDLKKKYVRNLAAAFSVTIFIALIFTGYSLAYKFYDVKAVTLPRGVVYEPTYISVEDIVPPEIQKPVEKIEPTIEKLNDTPVILDSIRQTSQKIIEEPVEEKQEEDMEQDSSAGGGRHGVANGSVTVPIQRWPEFPGGEKALATFMQQNIRHQVLAKNKRMRGVVVVSFVVKRDGRVGDIKIVRSLSPDIDEECIRVVSAMPLWKPAISGGRPIEIVHNLPFTIAF
jgi:protein TonB